MHDKHCFDFTEITKCLHFQETNMTMSSLETHPVCPTLLGALPGVVVISPCRSWQPHGSALLISVQYLPKLPKYPPASQFMTQAVPQSSLHQSALVHSLHSLALAKYSYPLVSCLLSQVLLIVVMFAFSDIRAYLWYYL